MADSLLAHIAGSFISQYENVANSSVCYLLNNYGAASSALGRMLDLEAMPVSYRTEMATEGHGRPDITGLDAEGNAVVIIEGKFWAHLTDNQPGNYLKKLTDSGRMMFLAPNRRMASLEADIRRRLECDDQRIRVQSWANFLDAVENENSKNHDGKLASDIQQLRDLCVKMDEEGMPPLSMTDLDPMNGRIFYQLVEVIDDCNKLMRTEWRAADFTGLKSGGYRDTYGFYFKALGFGCWLGVWAKQWFQQESQTPVWLQIQTEAFGPNEDIYLRLRQFDPDHAHPDTGKALYGVMLQPGWDRHQVVSSIVHKVRQTIEYLHGEMRATRFIEDEPEEYMRFIEHSSDGEAKK